ncbi:MAG: alanine dehydrogenase [Phycisphaerae bacterium]
MIIGVPKEIKPQEYRVALTPAGCEMLTEDGHDVLIESGAGIGSGFEDDAYVNHGATIAADATDVFDNAEMIMKVKEPQPAECEKMKPGQMMFTYFHFAASRELTESVRDTGAIAIAYETIEDTAGRLPLLTPMSEVAGRMAVQVGARCLEKAAGGRGVLLGGVPGTTQGHVVILGGGIVGTQAAKVAAGMGAQVVIMDIDLERLRHLADIMPPNVRTEMSSKWSIRRLLPHADLVIGAVLVPGGRTPMLISEEDLPRMAPGSVIVDVGVDQGGCVETSRPTTHQDPTYSVHDVIHYCVANMPGAVPRTSTVALTNATLPYARRIARGWEQAIAGDPGLAAGLNIAAGNITHPVVAETFDLPCTSLGQ